jgi:hypothetical protein
VSKPLLPASRRKENRVCDHHLPQSTSILPAETRGTRPPVLTWAIGSGRISLHQTIPRHTLTPNNSRATSSAALLSLPLQFSHLRSARQTDLGEKKTAAHSTCRYFVAFYDGCFSSGGFYRQLAVHKLPGVCKAHSGTV